MSIMSKLLISTMFVGAVVAYESTHAIKRTREGDIIQQEASREEIVAQQARERDERAQERALRACSYTEDVSFVNQQAAGVRLAGTLRLPRGASSKNQVPVVLFIGGAGAFDRCDEGVYLYKDISRHLASQGVASLIVDKRGCGKSVGVKHWSDLTLEDSVSDALASVEFLKKRSEVDVKKIGIIGHSEGGWIALMVAHKSKDIAFVITLAMPGKDGLSSIIDQKIVFLLNHGYCSEDIDLQLADIISFFKENDLSKRKQIFTELKEHNRLSYEEFMAEDLDISVEDLMCSNALQSFVFFEPTSLMKEIEIPMLAVFAEEDFQVNPMYHAEYLLDAFQVGKSSAWGLKIIQGLGPDLSAHMFKQGASQSHERSISHSGIDLRTSPELLSVVAKWILERTKKA